MGVIRLSLNPLHGLNPLLTKGARGSVNSLKCIFDNLLYDMSKVGRKYFEYVMFEMLNVQKLPRRKQTYTLIYDRRLPCRHLLQFSYVHKIRDEVSV